MDPKVIDLLNFYLVQQYLHRYCKLKPQKNPI